MHDLVHYVSATRCIRSVSRTPAGSSCSWCAAGRNRCREGGSAGGSGGRAPAQARAAAALSRLQRLATVGADRAALARGLRSPAVRDRPAHGRPATLPLLADRVGRSRGRTFQYPDKDSYDPERVFADSFGIFVDEEYPVQNIEISLARAGGVRQQPPLAPLAGIVRARRTRPRPTSSQALPEVVAWILGFGPDARVVGPLLLKRAPRVWQNRWRRRTGRGIAAPAIARVPEKPMGRIRRRTVLGWGLGLAAGAFAQAQKPEPVFKPRRTRRSGSCAGRVRQVDEELWSANTKKFTEATAFRSASSTSPGRTCGPRPRSRPTWAPGRHHHGLV